MSHVANDAAIITDVHTDDSTTRLLLGCGLVGPVLFTVAYLLEGAMRLGYDPGSWPLVP